jgi:uncharacterized protein YybS (DUF2232 family)
LLPALYVLFCLLCLMSEIMVPFIHTPSHLLVQNLAFMSSSTFRSTSQYFKYTSWIMQATFILQCHFTTTKPVPKRAFNLKWLYCGWNYKNIHYGEAKLNHLKTTNCLG